MWEIVKGMLKFLHAMKLVSPKDLIGSNIYPGMIYLGLFPESIGIVHNIYSNYSHQCRFLLLSKFLPIKV